MQVLSEADGRTKIIEHLGFSKEPKEEAKEEGASEVANGSVDEVPEQSQEPEATSAAKSNGQENKHRRITSLWGDGEDGDDFLSNLAANKGAKIDNPFHLLSAGNTSLEDKVTKALIMGNFEKAANMCLRDDRMADALIIANCGGKELLDKVQETYLAQKNGSPSYLRLLTSVVGKNLWDVVYNADLSNWKESMVILCTFADPSEFPDLCEGLGDRISDSGSRKDASFCYLVGSKLEKVVDIWIAELEEAERAGMEEPSDDSTFSVHARSLQQFIEKVTVFRQVTKFADSERSLASGWKLASLYDKYTEYADIVAAQGLLSIAQKYLDLLPTNYPAAEVARNRVKQATQTAQPLPQQTLPSRPAASSSKNAPRANAPVGYLDPNTVPAGGSPLNPYAGPAQPSAPRAGPYGRPNASPYQPAAPSPYAPPNTNYAPPAPIGGYPGQGGYSQPATYGAPPRNPAPAPTPPPPRAKEAGQWNDVPMVTKPPRVAAKAPGSFAPQPDTIGQLSRLAEALAAKNYDVASRLQVEIQRDKTEECGNWMVGVKRLITMTTQRNVTGMLWECFHLKYTHYLAGNPSSDCAHPCMDNSVH
ncbi:hypothetical protein P8C59_000256 [Phyllachora maydis]|uniref:Sec16 Sec23-binding domain-containing protein n=1 Tax=Phyllachora maydis TaxID=1825666 RepID=A0AAD9HX94_9PEZI|nr:hypothetical protein P8C59_000256 [Phyllachora maydis]